MLTKTIVIYVFILIILVNTTGAQSYQEQILTNHAAQDRYASYSPDGKRILFESDRSGNWDVFILNPDDGQVEQLTFEGNDQRRPDWHPGGDRVVYESILEDQTQLIELNLSTKKNRRIDLSGLTGQPVFANYSPDGKLIALSEKFSDDHAQLIVIDSLGKVVHRYENGGYRSFYPKWSPDGQSFTYFSRHETSNQDDEIYIISLDGSSEQRLTHWSTHNFCPSWSPDGLRIAYVTSMEDRRPEIYIMQADGTDQIRITDNEDGDTLPSWSPDGKKILITGYRAGNFEIVEIELSSK